MAEKINIKDFAASIPNGDRVARWCPTLIEDEHGQWLSIPVSIDTTSFRFHELFEKAFGIIAEYGECTDVEIIKE